MLRVKGLDEVVALLSRENSSTLNRVISVDILNSLDRCLSQAVACPEDVPGFTRATMDGYAVRAQDTFGASATLPSLLALVSAVEMGETPKEAVGLGQASPIPTGGMLPSGADSVVMVEYSEVVDDSTILVEKPVSPGENIILQGEDIKQGTTLFPQGHVIRAQDIGVLAAIGIEQVQVRDSIQVGVISTGNEIAYPFNPLQPGKVRDINSYSLRAALQADGFCAVGYGVVPDEFPRLSSCLNQALLETDIVLVSGGSSVGMLDLTYKVIDSLDDSQILVHGIAVRPGKPTIIARVGEKLVLGLPGNPVSAFMIYHVILRPFLRSLIGRKPEIKLCEADFGQNYPSAPGRDEFVLVKIEQRSSGLTAVPVYSKSSMMATMSAADGYVHIPAVKEGLYQGDQVSVTLF